MRISLDWHAYQEIPILLRIYSRYAGEWMQHKIYQKLDKIGLNTPNVVHTPTTTAKKDPVHLAFSSHTVPVCLVSTNNRIYNRLSHTQSTRHYPRQWLLRQLDLTYSQYPPTNWISEDSHCSNYWTTPRQSYNSLTMNLTTLRQIT